MIEQHNNSVIFKDTYKDENFADFTRIGVAIDNSDEKQWKIDLDIPNHFLIEGDAIYYNFRNNKYERALANNSPMQEVIGVVSKVYNNNKLELTLKGDIIIDRYNDVPIDSYLFLSTMMPGRLVQDEPDTITKIIAKKIENGIHVCIQRGYYLEDNESDNLYQTRYYTENELIEVINRIKRDIY